MLKLMLLCNTLGTSQKITNKVISKIENIRLVGIATTLDEAQTIIKESDPDLVITTNIKAFELIQERFILYSPGVILISNIKAKFDITYKNYIIVDYRESFTSISEVISNFVKENLKTSKKEKAIKILSHIGFNFKLSGTNYLLDSILYANSYKGSYSFETLFYDIYSYVAELNNTSSNVVKWAIERSINYLYGSANTDILKRIEKYFGIEYPEKITPKFTINFIANKLSS